MRQDTGRFLTDAEASEAIFSHIDHGTTDLGEGVWQEPVANYMSVERFAAERAMLRRLAVPFCPSAALPEAGSYVARAAAGTPLVAVRGADGIVRTFKNVCRHRGMQIVDGAGCAKSLSCPYHGWTYGLDGSLRGIPGAPGLDGEAGFPDFDKVANGLEPHHTVERHGLVFVCQEGAAEPEGLDGISELIGPDYWLLDSREGAVEANWKIFMEGFLEGYHIRATHPESFYPYGFDNLNLIERVGPHGRICFPFKRIEKLRGTPPAERSLEGAVTFVTLLFPNALVTQLSSHLVFVVLEPVSLTKTNLISYVLTNHKRGSAEEEERAKRDAAFVADTGAAEDRAVVEAIQKGASSGANTVFTFGKFESLISHFHQTLHKALGEG